MQRKEIAVLASAGTALALLAAVLIHRSSPPKRVMFVTGAVLRDDGDPNKQRPIENVAITASSGGTSGSAASGVSGLFRLPLRPPLLPGKPMLLSFRHPEYDPVDLTAAAGDRILVIRLAPKSRGAAGPMEEASVPIANVRVRYAVRGTVTLDVGSAARTFQVVNTGNVPCDGRPPCSPDGKWKAAIGSLPLDAGASKQFRNVRVSCIAGPCPFSRIESDQYSGGGRAIGVSVRNWSDTVTYLLEAEVVDTMVNETVRRSYPVIFGRSMNFTLPATAQGPTIEAEVEGAEIVFPIGPKLLLSWANCRLEDGASGNKLYRCELKPRYRFQ